MKTHGAQTPATTKHMYTTGESTESVDPTTAKPGKVTEENIAVTSPPEAPPTSKTTMSIATTLAATKPTTVPLSSSTAGLRVSSPTTGNTSNGAHQRLGQGRGGGEHLGPALKVFEGLCMYV